MRTRTLALTSVLALAACTEQKPPAPPPAKPAVAAPVPAPKKGGKVTLLITGHETGALPLKGPRLLAKWKAEEAWPDALAFSTGDLFSGAVISSRFLGKPTAEVMKAMQYKAAALGNHDLDLGRSTLKDFRSESGLTLLAANLRDTAQSDDPLKLPPTFTFEREGVKVGVVGFTSLKTIAAPVQGRAWGMELIPLDQAVGPALEKLAAEKPDVVLALIDDCYSALKPVLEANKGLRVDVVVGTRCEGESEDTSGSTHYFSAGDDLSHYVSVKFGLSAEGTRALEANRKDVPADGPEDADLAALRDRWQKQLDQELGEVIGFSKSGLKEDSAQLRTLVATALRDEAKADAALLNKKGVRAGLPKGPITRATIYDVIPFENAVLTVKVKGSDLQKLKANKEAVLVLPDKLQADQDYTLATTEYLYFGGDGLGLESVAPDIELTGQVWQTPVIEWLQKHPSDEKSPLEKQLK